MNKKYNDDKNKRKLCRVYVKEVKKKEYEDEALTKLMLGPSKVWRMGSKKI